MTKLILPIISFALTMTHPVHASSWTTSTSTDEMTGEISAYAFSDFTKPTKPLGFPYNDLKSWISFSCKKKEYESLAVGFTRKPILTNDETEDGYNLVRNRVKYDDTIIEAEFLQPWGSQLLSFTEDEQHIKMVMSSKSMLYELSWYSIGNIYFRYPLDGSSDAIIKARKICAGGN